MGSYLFSSNKNYEVKETPEFFFNMNNKITEIDSPKEQIQIYLSIRNFIPGNEYSIEFFSLDNSNHELLIGKTGKASDAINGIIDFQMSFFTDYYFEKQQNVAFKVFKNPIGYPNSARENIILTTIGNIMGSRGQVLVKKIQDDELIISATNIKNNNISLNLCLKLQRLNDMISTENIFFYLKREVKDGHYLNVYKSEFFKQTSRNVIFNKALIPTVIVTNGEPNKNLLIEINSYSNYYKKINHITTIHTTMNNLMSEKLLLDPNNNFKIENLSSLCKEYTFLDYIRGGTQIALTVGIDFTASNGKPTEYSSLHYVGKETFNSYEKAIRACGDIVAYYDYDQLFPVYGYGAVLSGYSNTVNHCFNINLKEDANVSGIDGILLSYRRVIPFLTFHGPTFFAPIIDRVIKTVKGENNNNVYNILMILTDGIINDMDQTIDMLVEASYLPISVIIIGIGYNDFGNMNVLDADDNPLFDKNGRKAARDLVQFVPFYKYQNEGSKLAEQVLEEVPKQLVEYYRLIGIPPNDPIIANLN